MPLPTILFYLFAALLVASGGFMVLTKNVLYAAFSLLITLLSLAAIYVLLFADFVAVAQLMVYVGGVLVLVLFGIMLTNKGPNNYVVSATTNGWLGGLTVLLVLAGLTYTIYAAGFSELEWLQQPVSGILSGGNSTVSKIGINLITTFVLPFEVASLILLIALMGATAIGSSFKRT